MKPLKSLLINLLKVANILVALGMLLTGYAYIFQPEHYGYLAVSYLFFPIFLALNLGLMVVWACIKLRYVIWPAVAFIICYHPVRLYCPLNLPQAPPKKGIKVLSYNTEIFGFLEDNNPEERRDSMLAYIVGSHADIVCLQESQNWYQNAKIDSTLKRCYPYSFEGYSHSGDNRAWILSRYPITQTHYIPYGSVGNLSIAAHIKTPQGTVLVVNNHLETNSFSPTDKSDFKRMLKGEMHRGDVKKESLVLFRKLMKATKIRAKQVQTVDKYLARNAYMPTIVCGDFNEGPNGYAVNLLSKRLKSAFVASGNLLGWSYHKSGMFVRIDHILFSSQFTSYQTFVDRSIDKSDHYPICTTLVWKNK